MKIGMLFPDYGSQFVGMAKELYDESRLVQEYFEEAYNCLSINFVKLCFASSDSELAALEHAYVAIFLASVSLAALVKEQQIPIAVVGGYGIGELSAICFADGISLPDGLYFLQKYALFYHEMLPQMEVKAAVVKGVNSLKLKRLCAELSKDSLVMSIAAYNNDYEHVVAGSAQLFELFEQKVREMGGVVKLMPVEQGLHNELMKPIVGRLEKYLEKIDFRDSSIPVIAGVDAALVTKGELIKRRMIKQLQEPIMWKKVLQHCIDWDIIVEIGPGSTLTNSIRHMYPNKPLFNINKRSDIQELKKVVAEMSERHSETTKLS